MSDSVLVRRNVDVALLITNMAAGGAERVSLNLVNAWVEMGLEVDLVLLKAHGPLLNDLDQRVRVVDLALTDVRKLPFVMAGYLRHTRPAALLACMWPLTAAAVLANVFSGMKARLVLAEHTTWSATRFYQGMVRRLILRWSMRLLFPLAGHVITVSEGAADDLARVSMRPRSKVLKVYNPVVHATSASMSVIRPDFPERWLNGGHFKILAVGSLKEIKDFSTLIRAFARLRMSLDARLLILGDGELRAELELLASTLGVGDYIDMPGFVNNTRAYYSEADVFVLSSRGEGLPTVIIEALQYGVPVVSTDCPSGPREILDDGRYGRLVPVGNHDLLADAMVDSLQAEHDKLMLKQRASVFSVERISRQYLHLLLPSRFEVD